MRIVQLMTDWSRYFNTSKNYWFTSFNAFLISLYFRCLSFPVVLVNTARPDGAFLFVVWFIHWKRMIHSLKTYDSTVLVYRQTKAEIVNTWTCCWFLVDLLSMFSANIDQLLYCELICRKSIYISGILLPIDCL